MSENFSAAATACAGLAARILGWKPPDFWRATPAELAMALGTPAREGAPPTRQEIETMMERDGNG